jgi:succinate dehydrogenase / fumarate reductase cytochrome b subunit
VDSSYPTFSVTFSFLLALKHIGLAIKLTIENKMARPVKYYMTQATGRGSTFASSSMPVTGLIILVFVVLHILQFKFGAYYEETYDGVVMRDLYRLLIEFYQNPLNVAWYIFSMACVAVHVSHGFWSAFQSIGFNHPKYTPLLKCLAKLFALVVFCGFSSLPIYCYVQGAQ